MVYDSKFKSREVDELFEVVMCLKTQEECYRFFEDICTANELHAISQRLQVAKMLSEGNTYTDIESKTKASAATISRVNKSLLYGSDGYKLVLDKIKDF